MRLLPLALVCGSTAWAQPVPSAPVEAPRVVLSEDTDARTSPPGGPLNVFVGQKVQSLPKGTAVDVLGRRAYGAFGGTNVWLEVRPAQQAASSAGTRSVWIYGGKQASGSVVPSGVVPEGK